MSTPTDEQQLRATLRRAERNVGTDEAARVVLAQACAILGVPSVFNAIRGAGADGLIPSSSESLPPLMGAAEAADVLGMKATNLKRLSPPLPVAAVISGRIPVYRESDVMAAKQRRDARRAA